MCDALCVSLYVCRNMCVMFLMFLCVLCMYVSLCVCRMYMYDVSCVSLCVCGMYLFTFFATG